MARSNMLYKWDVFHGKKKPKNGKIMENPLSMMDFRWDFLMDFSIATLDSAD
jgi:hypothetical protein